MFETSSCQVFLELGYRWQASMSGASVVLITTVLCEHATEPSTSVSSMCASGTGDKEQLGGVGTRSRKISMNWNSASCVFPGPDQ